MSLIRKHVAVLQAWACLALVIYITAIEKYYFVEQSDFLFID